EANQRVAELQKNVADMEKLAAMRARAGTAASAIATPVAVPVKASAVEGVVASDVAVVASDVAAASEVAASAVVASAPVARVKKRIEVVAETPEEPGFVESLFENPLALGGGALAILLGAGGLWYARRRQRPGVFEDSIITGGDLKANTVLGSTGGGVISTQSTENSFLTDFSRQGLGTIDTDEVDPIAEAEVYMAYGRDAQAEEILKDALHKDPSRHEIRMKLLDIYAARKDKVSYEEHASALFAITGGKGVHWDNAAENGRAIDPENPLYKALDANAGLVDTSIVAAAAVVGTGALAASAVMADVTEPDLSQSLDNDLDFELDLDPSQNLSESSSFDAGLSEVATPEMNLNDTELPLDNLDDLSFDATVMDIEALDKELDFPASAASVNDEMMALDLPIDLGVAANHTESELADLDALADFDLDAALNPSQEFSSEITASGLSEFESMTDSLNLDISAPLKEVADDSASALADFDLPELTIPDLPSAVDALVGDLGAGLDGVSELGSAASLDAADGLDDIGLDFDFDLNEES
ncbi:MAG: type IV pilus assembly protein FimV, partial [Deefgea sp.]